MYSSQQQRAEDQFSPDNKEKQRNQKTRCEKKSVFGVSFYVWLNPMQKSWSTFWMKSEGARRENSWKVSALWAPTPHCVLRNTFLLIFEITGPGPKEKGWGHLRVRILACCWRVVVENFHGSLSKIMHGSVCVCTQMADRVSVGPLVADALQRIWFVSVWLVSTTNCIARSGWRVGSKPLETPKRKLPLIFERQHSGGKKLVWHLRVLIPWHSVQQKIISWI